MEGLGINLGYLLVQIANFAIIFVVILVWVVKPVMGLLAKRRETIAKGLQDAQEAAEARANAQSDAERIVSEAQAEAAGIIKEASSKAETAAGLIKAEADTNAAKILEDSKADLEEDRIRMLRELRGQVSVLAIAAAQKLIGESLDEARQHALIDEFFSGIKDASVTVIDDVELDDEEVIVTSALPLSDEEQKTIQKDLSARAGAKAAAVSFAFKVDPSILGGLVVQVGDRMLDGSVANQLQELSTNL